MNINKRNISFEIGDAPAPRWCDDDEARSAFFDAFSLLLPPGERFFIRSVHAYVDAIEDPDLLAEVKAFSAQEAFHTREHEAYNRALELEGLALEPIYARVDRLLDFVKGNLRRLAITVGLEHLTACFGHVTLKHPELLARSDPRYRDLWTWHSLEEIEHKAVAFDVFRHAAAHLPRWKAYLLRCGALVLATRHIARMHADFINQILALRGPAGARPAKRRVLWLMLVYPGYYRRAFWPYMRFFSPFFHPSAIHGGEGEGAWARHFDKRADHKETGRA